MEPFVSVVVPTFNRRESLQRLLESLRHQTYPPARFEVVLVDDGSTDGSAELARGLDLPYSLRVIEQANKGPAEARNRGVSAAKGPLVLFVDDDVIPVPELIAEHVAARREDAEAVVIGPMSAPRDWPRPVWIRWGEELLQEQYRAMVNGEWACSARQFYTANASLPRDRFLQVGGFDTRFKRNEDLELALRLADSGLSFLFNPRADVLHYAEHSFQKWRRATYQYGRYDVIMHRDKGLPALVMAERQFHQRNPLIRVLARACVGRPARLRPALNVLRDVVLGAERLGWDRPAMLALSGISNLLYWQGVSDEIGGPERLWTRVDAYAPSAS